MLYKKLLISGLVTSLVACGSQNNVQPTPNISQQNPQIGHENKPAIENTEGQNQSPALNNSKLSSNIATKAGDNTAIYGGISKGQPVNYRVVDTYYPSLAQNFRQRYIILHYTALNLEKSIRALVNNGVSAHYLVNDLDNDEIYQLVDENKRAYHAGISAWRDDKNLNDTSIGIEIVNLGFKTEGGAREFFAFPDFQVKKIASLVKDLADRYNIEPYRILAHSDIAPSRKQDPGPLFPWKQLYTDHQIGMWYNEDEKISMLSNMDYYAFSQKLSSGEMTMSIQQELKKLGYGIEASGQMDEATRKCIEAFQAHFRPEKMNGIWDMECQAILTSLNNRYKGK
jgi:N-acetylmuramoyl-L-alanine amidase